MDILAHSLWTAAVYDQVNRKKRTNLNLWWAAFWGIFPDLFAFTIPFVILFSHLISGGVASDFKPDPSNATLAYHLYNISHSFVTFFICFGLASLVMRKIPWVMAGWAIHILIDIPTHSKEFYPTPLFWPISNWKFTHGISWGTPWFMAINYSALILVWGYLYYRRKKDQKQP